MATNRIKQRPFSASLRNGRKKLPPAVVACLIWLVLSGSQFAHAGCEYGHAPGSSASAAQDGGTSSRALFLGKWIYEGGEFRFLPWQSLPPCSAPGCRGNDQVPQTASLPLRLEHSSGPFLSDAPETLDAQPDPLVGLLELADLLAIEGYRHDYEYPP